MEKFIKGDIVSFYSDVLKKRIAGVVVKHWACDRYKIEISENNQPRYVYISEYNLKLLQETTMTQQQFNDTIIAIANKIFSIREYSYGRRGAKFDYRRPNLMLSSCEKQRVEDLEKKALEVYDEFIKNRGTKRT